MIWSKQIYVFDVSKWLQGDNLENPLSESRKEIRNNHFNFLDRLVLYSKSSISESVPSSELRIAEASLFDVTASSNLHYSQMKHLGNHPQF